MKLRFFIFIFLILFTTLSQAKSMRLFSLHRANYYPEKTMVYDLEYDESTCRITNRQPVSVYFVSTNAGSKLSGFSAQNRDYFNARELKSPNGSTVSFTFKAVNELESKLRSEIVFQVQLTKTETQCLAQTTVLKNGNTYVQNLKKISVHFNLRNIPGLGNQPSGIDWVSLSGQPSRCLFGSCK